MISYLLVWYIVQRSGPYSIGMTMILNPCGGSSYGPAYSVSFPTKKTKYINLNIRLLLTLCNQVKIELMLCKPHIICRFSNLFLLKLRVLFPLYMSYMPCYITAMLLLSTMLMAIWKILISHSGMVWIKCSSRLIRWMILSFLISSEQVAKKKYIDRIK